MAKNTNLINELRKMVACKDLSLYSLIPWLGAVMSAFVRHGGNTTIADTLCRQVITFKKCDGDEYLVLNQDGLIGTSGVQGCVDCLNAVIKDLEKEEA